MLPLLWLLVSFLFGAQVGHADPQAFRFTIDPVNQCEVVSLKFQGDNLRSAAPTALKVLPINGTAYNLPLPPVNVTDEGVTVTFLPLREGTTFIATLDDETGENTSKVSDISRVLPGSSSDCLPEPSTQRTFSLVNEDSPAQHPSQCQDFSVTYNSSATGPPKVRLYSPRFVAYELNRTADDGAGTATYTMTAGRGFEYILLFIDDSGQVMETTSLMNVLGDTSSPTDCFDGFQINNGFNQNKNSDNKGSLSQKTIIGLAIGGGVIALIACVMVAYLIWERRHRRRVSIHFDPSMMEKRTADGASPSPQSAVSVTLPSMTGPTSGGTHGDLGPQVTTTSPQYGTQGVIRNPAYAATSPRSSNFTRSSGLSWGQDRYSPNDGPRNKGSVPLVAPGALRQNDTPSSQESIQSFDDIERMLNNQEQRLHEEQAELERAQAPRALPKPKPVQLDSPLPSPSSVTVSQPVIAVRAIPQRGHLRDPSDIPRAPSTDLLSVDNPFGDENGRAAKGSRIRERTNRPSGTLLVPPSSIGNRSHFSHLTTSSFGDAGDPDLAKNDAARSSSRIIISGTAFGRDSYANDNDTDDMPRRPYPSANGLGRGNGEPRRR